jgi:hypothetical protein
VAWARGILRAGRLLSMQPLRLGWWKAPCTLSSVYSVRMINNQLINLVGHIQGYPATNPPG